MKGLRVQNNITNRYNYISPLTGLIYNLHFFSTHIMPLTGLKFLNADFI